MLGEVVKGFTITGRLGKGATGEVWMAEQQIVKTRVAIKLLLAELSSDQDLVRRLFNEAIAVSRIRHAGITKIYDAGYYNGAAFLIMELLEGETLGARLGRERLAIGQIGELGRQITSVLEATHAAGIVHRDLKPENVFLIEDAELPGRERAKLLDFGIAKLGTTVGMTGSHERMGTPQYMAPEQWTSAAKADARSDVYAVGCIAFEMCCGRPVFDVASLGQAYARHVSAVPARVRALAPHVPVELDDAIARALAKQPADRPTMRELRTAFSAVAAAYA